MNKELKQKWIAALRSYEYAQGSGALRDANEYCCLGVLCDIINPQGWDGNTHDLESHEESYLSLDGLNLVGLSEAQQRELGTMNDEGVSFKEIAQFIEECV